MEVTIVAVVVKEIESVTNGWSGQHQALQQLGDQTTLGIVAG